MKVLTAAFLLAASIPAFSAMPPVPRPAKELTILEPNGKQSLLSQYKGKVVVIQFLFTTCPHCQAFSKELTKLQFEMGPSGVQALGVAFDDNINAGTTAAYVKQFGVGFPVGYATRDTVMNYLGLSVMDRWVVPQIMIVDKKGVVRAQSEPTGTVQLQDPQYLKKFISDLQKEGAAAAPKLQERTPAKAAPATAGKKS